MGKVPSVFTDLKEGDRGGLLYWVSFLTGRSLFLFLETGKLAEGDLLEKV